MLTMFAAKLSPLDLSAAVDVYGEWVDAAGMLVVLVNKIRFRTNSFSEQRQSRRRTVGLGAPAEGMALEGLRTTKILLTSTKRSTTTITECHTVHFYRDRLGRYRIGDIDAY